MVFNARSVGMITAIVGKIMIAMSVPPVTDKPLGLLARYSMPQNCH